MPLLFNPRLLSSGMAGIVRGEYMKRRFVGLALVALISIAVLCGAVIADEKSMETGKAAAKKCTACHPASDSSHQKGFVGWESSAHSRSLGIIAGNANAAADCFSCHSDEGFKAKLQGKKADIAQKGNFNPVTCATCHESHESKNPHHLVMSTPESLCTSCHSQRAILQGKGAKGMDEARSFHSAVDCISCHMTGANHRMKLLRPDDPNLPETRLDTCTGCHKDNNRKTRAGQLKDWQAAYKEEMDPLQGDIKLITTALKENPNLLDAAMKTKWDDAVFNINLLVKDGSKGAHNFDLSLSILDAATKDMRAIKALIKGR
jgi:predicted CXXCH cytochrome family protein